jgi:hypothetical protein
MAFKKITAGDSTTVASGKTVSFITKNTGSIVLLPGFTAEQGCTFTTQRKDLSQYERLCGGSICHGDDSLSYAHKAGLDVLRIYNLRYVVRIGYDIWKRDGWSESPIYSRSYNISSDGDFSLWDCIANTVYPTGIVWYKIDYSLQYCNNTIYISSHNFYVDYSYEKSLHSESGEPENLPQFSPPHPPQSATAPPNFVIIPNPNSGNFQLETNFPLSDIANLKITNPLGVIVYKTQDVTEDTLQLSNSASGMFFVVIVLKDGTMLTQKMMVQR